MYASAINDDLESLHVSLINKGYALLKTLNPEKGRIFRRA